MGCLTWLVVSIMILMSNQGQAQNMQAPSGLSEYAQLEADAGTGFLGDKEDWVDLGSAQAYFTAPKGWSKEANVSVSKGKFFYFLRYRPGKNDSAAFILLTGIKVGPADTDVLEYSKKLVEGLRRKSPGDQISDPKKVKMKGADAVYFERTSAQGTSFWARYQFLVAGRVLKLQLAGTQGADKKDLEALDQVARSIRIAPK